MKKSTLSIIVFFFLIVGLILYIQPTEEEKKRYEFLKKTVKDNNLSFYNDFESDYYKIIKMNDDEKIILFDTYNNQYNLSHLKGGTNGHIDLVGILNIPTKNNLKKICWLENIINDISNAGGVPPDKAIFLNCDSASYETLDDYVGSKFKTE